MLNNIRYGLMDNKLKGATWVLAARVCWRHCVLLTAVLAILVYSNACVLLTAVHCGACGCGDALRASGHVEAPAV